MDLKQVRVKRPALFICGVYLFCFTFRAMEYMLVRTDHSFIGEAFLHKAAGIIILALAIRFIPYRWADIGFQKQTAIRHSLFGLLLGICAFAAAYGSELMILQMSGSNPKLAVYISSFSLNGNQIMRTNVWFLAVCVTGNILNVLMEEGIFRGLFIRLGERKRSFIKAALFSSLLFGIWHTAAPLRELFDGNMRIGTAIAAAIAQIFLTGLMGMELCLLVKITGSLWAGMADHFVNNFLVNILHVITPSGADELQVIRISVAQTISFIIILLIYWKRKSNQQATFRSR